MLLEVFPSNWLALEEWICVWNSWDLLMGIELVKAQKMDDLSTGVPQSHAGCSLEGGTKRNRGRKIARKVN